MTPNDSELHRVTLSDCCPWPCPRISLICKALTTVSYGRAHRFKPCTPTIESKTYDKSAPEVRQKYGMFGPRLPWTSMDGPRHEVVRRYRTLKAWSEKNPDLAGR